VLEKKYIYYLKNLIRYTCIRLIDDLQVEMAGSSLFDYIHSQDHQELADQLGIALASKYPCYKKTLIY
jgi:hypothetical protein